MKRVFFLALLTVVITGFVVSEILRLAGITMISNLDVIIRVIALSSVTVALVMRFLDSVANFFGETELAFYLQNNEETSLDLLRWGYFKFAVIIIVLSLIVCLLFLVECGINVHPRTIAGKEFLNPTTVTIGLTYFPTYILATILCFFGRKGEMFDSHSFRGYFETILIFSLITGVLFVSIIDTTCRGVGPVNGIFIR